MSVRLSVSSAMLLVAVVLGSCSPAAGMEGAPEGDAPSKNGDGYFDLTAKQLDEMLSSKDFTLVNVHIPYEGEIRYTDRFLPYDQIEDSLDQLPDKSSPIVLYCRSGRMSTIAAKALVALGYTQVFELNGGMVAWEQAGLPLEMK